MVTESKEKTWLTTKIFTASSHSCAPTRYSYKPTYYLPPEGRQVYRPWDRKYTARGTVSNEPKEKNDGV